MRDFSRAFAGLRVTNVGRIFSISFRQRMIFLKVGSDWKFISGKTIPLAQVKAKWVERRKDREQKESLL